MRHEFVANAEDSLLLIIDVQEAMEKVMERMKPTVDRINQLIESARVLDVPVLVTEQYRKGLGNTVAEVKVDLAANPAFHKEHFSACLEDGFLETVRRFGRRQIVIAGMETHVCVLQTALDLIASGYQLHLVRNGVASRFKEDWETAVELLRNAGAVITTAEIVIFQWARRANTERFKRLLPIVK
jgi:nicotinamidase-related amidase